MAFRFRRRPSVFYAEYSPRWQPQPGLRVLRMFTGSVIDLAPFVPQLPEMACKEALGSPLTWIVHPQNPRTRRSTSAKGLTGMIDRCFSALGFDWNRIRSERRANSPARNHADRNRPRPAKFATPFRGSDFWHLGPHSHSSYRLPCYPSDRIVIEQLK